MIITEDGRKKLYQWDLNQRLPIESYPAGTQVHFARANAEKALVVTAIAAGDEVYAPIPNILLQTAGELYVYIYPISGDEAHTDYRETLIVIPRAKPEDYVYTEIQAMNWGEVLFEMVAGSGAGAHNAIYRGKNLGSTPTAAQYAAIKAGTFDDMYIGDYWSIGGINYRIAAFDYYLNCGDTACTAHHVVIVPDTCLYTHVMNDTDTTDGGYVGSKMYTEGLEQAKTTIKAAFSGHVLSKRIYLTNATSNGYASAGAWCDSEVDLMCEQMVYGSGIFSPVSTGSVVLANYRVEKSQLPLFQHDPSRITNRATWWLRDVISAFSFACVASDGYAHSNFASYSFGVRPAFCVS